MKSLEGVGASGAAKNVISLKIENRLSGGHTVCTGFGRIHQCRKNMKFSHNRAPESRFSIFSQNTYLAVPEAPAPSSD